ncbi:MAG: cyclic nucleotide-binding domain-containing protein [Acidimicrobiales bacterium]
MVGRDGQLGGDMRTEGSVTSISWIPSEAISGAAVRAPFEIGITHYDEAPPEVVTDLEELRVADRFRFANELRGFIETEHGRIVDYGQSGGGAIGSTTVRLGGLHKTFQAVPLPDICPEPIVTDRSVTFVQTAGGRTGLPAPRRVRRAPFVQLSAPLVWTTLALTIFVDGRSRIELRGASSFPRHWIYDSDGKLAQKSGLIDFSTWYRRAFGVHSPWGDRDSSALTTAIETALERELSSELMRAGERPRIEAVPQGAVVIEQGDEGRDLFLVLDGVVRVEVDGKPLVECGPGSIHGERAALEGGKRTATVRAVTKCKLAFASADQFDKEVLVELASGHRRELG